MIKTMEREQLKIDFVSYNPVMHTTSVFASRMYVESKYGTLLGTIIKHKGHFIAFCPMEISVQLIYFEDLYALNNSCGKLLSVFYMDNDEVIDIQVYKKFIEDELPQDKLENIYINKIIPFMEKKGILN